MRKLIWIVGLFAICTACIAQGFKPTYEEKVVYEGPDVIFRQIDAHTWEGNGHLMANETLYLIEGEERAILLDAGTDIKELDKIVAGIPGHAHRYPCASRPYGQVHRLLPGDLHQCGRHGERVGDDAQLQRHDQIPA